MRTAGQTGTASRLLARLPGSGARLAAFAGIALASCAGASAASAAGHAAPAGPTVTVTGGGPGDTIPYGQAVTLTLHATGVQPPGAPVSISLSDSGGIPANAERLGCVFSPAQVYCTDPRTKKASTADKTTWTPNTTTPTTTAYDVVIMLQPWGLPEASTLRIAFNGVSVHFYGIAPAAKPTPAKPKPPDLSGKVTVKCGTKFSAEGEGSASYKVGGNVGVDGSVTLTVPCGSDGKPAPAPQPVVVLTTSQGAANTTVIVLGAGFTHVRKVLFGRVPAKSYRVVSKYKLVAVAPPGKGTVSITVTGAKGTSPHASKARFTYT